MESKKKRFTISVPQDVADEIAAANRDLNPAKLRVGQKVVIPASSGKSGKGSAAKKGKTAKAVKSSRARRRTTAKLVEFDDAPFGIIGLETALPITLTLLVHSGILTLPDLIAKFTTGPAEVLGLGHCDLAEGHPADITVFDPDCAYEIDPSTFHSKARNTPFGGMKVRGRVRQTIVGGRTVYRYPEQA